MMSPNPLHRPTVTELLYNKKLLLLHQNRQRWQTFNKIVIIRQNQFRSILFIKNLTFSILQKTTIRNTKKIVWAKLCTFKMIIYRLFYYIFTSFKSKQQTNPDQSDSSNENYLDFSQIDVSSNRKFGEISVQIVNSTPLNHFPSSRLRKNLTNNSCW